MRQTRRGFLGAMAGTTALAGCAGDGADGGGGGADTPTPTPTESEGATDTPTESDTPTQTEPGTETTAESSVATVRVSEHPELGEVVVDGDGMTLYMFDPDPQGEGASECYDDCASAWPPLTSEGEPTAGEDVTAELSTFEREDGSVQVAANGWPLYYWQNDEEPGDATGQGVNDVWWVLRPDGTPVRSAGTPTPTPTQTGSGNDGSY